MFVLALLFFVVGSSHCAPISIHGDESVDLATFRADALAAHNNLRTQHQNTNPLSACDACNDYAQSRAEHLAEIDNMVHDGDDESYGENLFVQWGDSAPTGTSASELWYNEISKYDFNNPGFSMSTGHFTQLVWASSSQVGFGIAQSASGSWYVAANYLERGNMEGQFEQNVQPLN